MLAEKTIRKHVAIIHAYSLMSVLQRKIINVLLYEAIKNNNHQTQQNSVAVECHIPFSSLSKAVKFNSNNTQYLKEAIDGLASLTIEWNLLKDKAPTNISFLNLRVLHGSPTFYQDKTLNFSFHKVMLALVDNPLIYGTLDVDLQSEFESKYAHALYENSTRFINLQKNKVIPLATFRKILGVQEDKYSNMREFTRNVIAPSLAEVNDRSHFVVSLESTKSGRKTTGFEVTVTPKKKSVIVIADNIPSMNINEKITQEIKQMFGVLKKSVLENILKNYSEEYILEKLAYTKKYAKKERSDFYPVRYFISAIKHDYKFKDEPLIENSKEKKLEDKVDWKTKLHHLQLDLDHWERLYKFARAGKNETQIQNIKNIVLKCQAKLKQHYLEQTTQEEVV